MSNGDNIWMLEKSFRFLKNGNHFSFRVRGSIWMRPSAQLGVESLLGSRKERKRGG